MMITAYKHIRGIGTVPHVIDDKLILITVNRFTRYQYINAYKIPDLEEIWSLKHYVAGGTYNDIAFNNNNNNIIIVPFYYSKIGAIDVNSGQLLSVIDLAPEGELWRNKSTPCFINENTILAPIATYISLLNIERNGELSLIRRLKPDSPSLYFYGRVIIKNQYAISYAYNSEASYIVFIDIESGNVDRAIPIGPPHVRAYNSISPVAMADNDIIFAVNINDELLAIDSIKKEIISKIKIPSNHYLNLTTPFIIDDFIVVGGYKEINVILWNSRTKELKIANKLQFEAVTQGLIRKVKEIDDKIIELLIYAPPYLYLISYDKINNKLSLIDDIIVGFIPYTTPEVHFNRNDAKLYAYIVGGDSPAESILLSINISDILRKHKITDIVKRPYLSYSLDIKQKILKIYINNLEEFSLKKQTLIIDLYPLLGTRRSITINDDTKVLNIPLSDDEVKRIIMKQYGESVVVLIATGENLIQIYTIKSKDRDLEYPKSYLNVSFYEKIKLFKSDKIYEENNLAIYLSLSSLKTVLENKYNINYISLEELKNIVYDLINNKEYIEFSTIDTEFVRKIAKYMRMIRRDHTIYDIFDTYEEETLNAYGECQC
mgnify:CR=1 FL=1